MCTGLHRDVLESDGTNAVAVSRSSSSTMARMAGEELRGDPARHPTQPTQHPLTHGVHTKLLRAPRGVACWREGRAGAQRRGAWKQNAFSAAVCLR